MNDTDRARDALHALDPGCDREQWVRIAMGSKAAGLPVEDFIDWSSQADNYGGEADCRAVWRSINGHGPIGPATLFGLARDAGWRDPGHRKPQEPPKLRPKGSSPAFDFAAVWRDSEAATGVHPYVAKKLGLADGCKVYRGPLTVAGQALDGALLVPVYDAGGKLQSWQAIPAEGDKRSAPGAPIRGGRFVVGGPVEDAVFVVEGIGQAWSAHQATGKPAVVAFGAGNVGTIARALRAEHPQARIVIVADAGKEADAERVAAAIRGAFVAMPEGSPANFDLNDYHQEVRSLEAVAALLAQAAEPEPIKPEVSMAFGEPANLFRDAAAPRFDLADVPAAIRRMAEAFGAATGFDASGAVMAAVVAGAAVIDDRYRLAVRPSSDWFESARLWAVLIATPSAGKSPTMRAATDPIKDMHTEMFARWVEANGDLKDDEQEPKPALFTSDATTEALADRLRDNPRGILMLTEEFASWIGGIDAYRDGAGARNRGEWLQLYDGGPHQVDRVKRGSFLVPNWGASVLAACTPAGLRDQVRKLPDDGLIHRFMPCVMAAPKAPGTESARDALRDWSILLREVHAATTTDKPRARTRISTSAQMVFDAEAREIREHVDAVYDMAPALASHLGKHPGMLARVALVFHVLDRRPGDAIERDTMEQAARFMRTVRRHAAAMFLGILSSAHAIDLARGVARSIVADQDRPETIGRHYMGQRCRAFRQAHDTDRRLAVQALEDAGWLFPVPDSKPYGGWSASEWRVNPAVFDLFAAEGAAHRKRRQAVRELLEAC